MASHGIPFNRPAIAGHELAYISEAVTRGNIAADGYFTQLCAQVLEQALGIHRVLLVRSCAAALEMAAMLCDLQPDDEVILPSFTSVSAANAFARLGARLVFVDIREDTLNIDEQLIERAITPRTKVIVPTHYAGVACDMRRIMQIAEERGLLVVEDAADALAAAERERPLGAIGHMGAFSFHETQNYTCGEGGALCLNRPELEHRAEIIRDKGTNRKAFFRGEVDKYTWVEIGSSYVLSEIACAFLYGQLEQLEPIAQQRRRIYEFYESELAPLEAAGLLRLPSIPAGCRSNHHMYYVLLPDAATRPRVLRELRAQGIDAVFHYVPLHLSPMGHKHGRSDSLPVTEDCAARLIRLPFFPEITEDQQRRVVSALVAACSGAPPTSVRAGAGAYDGRVR
jgi:dTDP-4-amino-4,6-dideoxygalactose transaminase